MIKRDMKKDNYLLFMSKYMSKNYVWIAGVVSVSIVIILNVFKFFEYLNALLYSSYFGLDIELFNLNGSTFVYRMCLSIIFILASVSLFYCFKQIKDNINMKKVFIKENIIDLILIIVANLFLNCAFGYKFLSFNTLINLILFAVIEYFVSMLFFKKANIIDSETIISLNNYLKLIPFIAVLLIISYLICLTWDVQLVKEYRIIENNKVIISTNINYYLTLDCEIDEKNNELIIHKGTQTKIDNSNVKSKLRKFKSIEMEE